MQTSKNRIFNRWTLRSLALAASIITVSIPPVQAGIPVIDGGNLTQNIMTAIESVAKTLKQIEQYQTQLQQYENQLQNTMAPAAYIWDQAQTTINRLIAAQNTLAYYENQLGSLDRYLAKFQDVAYYRSSPASTAAAAARMRSGPQWLKTAAWRPSRKRGPTMRCSRPWPTSKRL